MKDAEEQQSTCQRELDLCWEALVQETNANPAMERGKLNVALKAIREAAFTEGLHETSLPEEIRLRARAYRTIYPNLMLTPTALATHWFRVIQQPAHEQSASQRALDELRRRG